MSQATLNLIVGLALLVGVAGTVFPVLPGVFLIAGALIAWAVVTGGSAAWTATLVALAVLGVGQLLKYLVPGRRMTTAGVPGRSLVVGGLMGIVGFFVVPVVGVFLGFIVGVYVAEHARLREWPAARDSTIAAMKATGLSILIELAAALLACVVWAYALTQV